MAVCWVPTPGTAVPRLRRASQEASALGFGLLQGAAAADRVQEKLPRGKKRLTMREVKFYQAAGGNLG